jgi:hypothetical protein
MTGQDPLFVQSTFMTARARRKIVTAKRLLTVVTTAALKLRAGEC